MTVSTLTVVPEASAPGTAPCAEPPTFYLGTHQPHWLALATVRVPLFVSDRRLRRYRTLPRATTSWALDSGGFTELAQYGTWDHGPTPAVYVARIRRYRDQVGRLVWAAPQDWMCEPHIQAKTGLTVAAHQDRTVANYLRLRDLAPELPIMPVVQGWRVSDYLRCVDLLTSADSMAWSSQARHRPPLPDCRHRTCANCPRYALRWRTGVLAAIDHATGPVRPLPRRRVGRMSALTAPEPVACRQDSLGSLVDADDRAGPWQPSLFETTGPTYPAPGRRPRLLDLFCGAGGASAGYHAAGFDVVGVDLHPQPDYPFPFIHADALTVDLSGFDVIAASPPCQRFSTATPPSRRDSHPDLIDPVRQRLAEAVTSPGGRPWAYVIENVPGAPLLDPVTVCGDTLRLGVRRHRLFESNLSLVGTPCWHDRPAPPVAVYGTYGQRIRLTARVPRRARSATPDASAA